MSSRSTLRIGIAVVGVLAIACGTAGPGPAPQAPGAASPAAPVANFNASSTLTIRIDGPWASFDPSPRVGVAGNLPSGQLSAGLYDRLVELGPDGKFVPYLATAWEQTPTSVKFTLRKDVTCSDGTPLTASAVAKSFDFRLGISDAKTRSASVPGTFGPGPFTVSADDAAGTFTLTLRTPFDVMTSFALGTEAFVICPKGVASLTALDNEAFGTGPYRLESQDRPNSLTLKLRPEWKWGPGGRTAEGLPGTLVYRAVANETTAANLLLTGGLDIARIQGVDVKRLIADPSLGKLQKQGLYTNPLWLQANPGRGTADIKVREAIFHAISADDYNQAAYGGLGEVTTSIFAKNAPCYEPATAQLIPPTDINKAKQVLLSAGYTESGGKIMKDGKPVTLQVVGSNAQGSGPEYVATQLTKVGFTVDFVLQEHTVYSAQHLQPGRFDVIVPGIASDIIGSYIGSYRGDFPPTGRNFSRLNDPAIHRLIDKALTSTGAEACSTWKEVQVAMLKGFYSRPLSAQTFYFFSKNPKWVFSAANTSTIQPYSLK